MLKSGLVFRRAGCAPALLMMLVAGRNLRAQSTTDGAISVTVTDAVELLGEAFNVFNHQNVTGVNNAGYSLADSPVTTRDGSSTRAATRLPA